MDAIAVTLATHGTRIGVAPLGTALTEEQAHQLAALRDHVGNGNTSGSDLPMPGFDPWLIVATDNDTNLAGQVAAERDYWLLAPHDLDPGHALLPTGLDPADIFTLRGPAALRDVLQHPNPLATTSLDERLTNLPPDQARTAAAQVLATRPARHWNNGATRIATHLQLNTAQAQRDLIPAANTWARDPRQAARTHLNQVGNVGTRMQQAALQPPAQRWASLAAELDPRLPHEPDWPALAQLLNQAHNDGHNVPAVTRQLIAERPLTEQPAQDLRYRLVATLDIPIDPGEALTATPPGGAAKERQVTPNASATPVSPRR